MVELPAGRPDLETGMLLKPIWKLLSEGQRCWRCYEPFDPQGHTYWQDRIGQPTPPYSVSAQPISGLELSNSFAVLSELESLQLSDTGAQESSAHTYSEKDSLPVKEISPQPILEYQESLTVEVQPSEPENSDPVGLVQSTTSAVCRVAQAPT